MEINDKPFFKLFGLILLGLVVFSCGGKEKESPLFGNWYGFEQDSTYYELYINDTLIVLNHENIGPIGYDYQIHENILIVSNAAGMERIWLLEDLEKEFFTIKDSLETITYFKLEVPLDFFKSIQDSSSYAEFKDGFTSRYVEKKDIDAQ
ncbi:hypothetical protein [Aquiflexum sp.]|uniref:hypothetical protein n=1 Tax=Aquiflexum sp. TaxID=1872584 RepID=UPI0035934268